MQAVESWLVRLAEEHPHATIVYIMGNHDSHPDLQQLLTRLAQRYAHFRWEPEYYQKADCLFCHGDILDAGGRNQLADYRQKFQHERQASRTAHRLYDAAVAMRLHRTIPKLFHRPRATCLRLNELMSIDPMARHPTPRSLSQQPFAESFWPLPCADLRTADWPYSLLQSGGRAASHEFCTHHVQY